MGHPTGENICRILLVENCSHQAIPPHPPGHHGFLAGIHIHVLHDCDAAMQRSDGLMGLSCADDVLVNTHYTGPELCEFESVFFTPNNDGVCGNANSRAAVNILTDIFFAIIPIPMLWNVQINPRTKASLICIMGLGVL